jgi:hypothetical protein
MKGKKAGPWQESFYHQPTPNRVAPRMGNKQRARGIKNVKKSKRG